MLSMFSGSHCGNCHCVCAGAHIFLKAQLVPKMATVGALWKIWGEADSLG